MFYMGLRNKSSATKSHPGYCRGCQRSVIGRYIDVVTLDLNVTDVERLSFILQIKYLSTRLQMNWLVGFPWLALVVGLSSGRLIL
jgi:hypothetical protein